MKLVINYDFLDAIRNVNEPLGPLKVIRNNRFTYVAYGPMWYSMDQLLGYDPRLSLESIILVYGLMMGFELGMNRSKILFDGMDIYAEKARSRLIKLSSQLKDINVKTAYDMLLKSELYEHKYKIELNKDKLPFLKEQKYILVPSYGFDGKEKETSILQEHDIGSKSYMLSVGEPEKQYKRVLVKSYS